MSKSANLPARLLMAAMLAVIVAAALPAPAQARGRVSVGVMVGPGWGWPYYPYGYYPPAYYPYPAVMAPAEPTVYVEQGQAPASAPPTAATAPQAYWYYCRESQAYYPSVASCAGGWLPVPPRAVEPR